MEHTTAKCPKCGAPFAPLTPVQADAHVATCGDPLPPAKAEKTPEEKEKDRITEECKVTLGAFLKEAPKVMADLTRMFIACTDLTERAKIRLRLKAILDLISVDTDYPPVPALNAQGGEGGLGDYLQQGPRRRLRGARPFELGVPAPALQQQIRAAVEQEVGGVAPVPGAEPAPGNDIVLG